VRALVFWLKYDERLPPSLRLSLSLASTLLPWTEGQTLWVLYTWKAFGDGSLPFPFPLLIYLYRQQHSTRAELRQENPSFPAGRPECACVRLRATFQRLSLSRECDSSPMKAGGSTITKAKMASPMAISIRIRWFRARITMSTRLCVTTPNRESRAMRKTPCPARHWLDCLNGAAY
jgi:hypothetical protein